MEFAGPTEDLKRRALPAGPLPVHAGPGQGDVSYYPRH